MKITRALLAVVLVACASAEARPIRYGLDDCAQCRMVITDQRYGGELLLATGKAIKFDAIECMLDYSKAASKPATAWVIDFDRPGRFIDAASAVYLQIPQGRSPMGRGLIASRDSATVLSLRTKLGGTVKRWNEL